MKNRFFKILRIIGQIITVPFYLFYGLGWSIMLLIKMWSVLMSLAYYRANIPQWQLEIGRVFLIHGANLQVGQPVRFKIRDKVVTRWVKNLYFDFKNSRLNTSYSETPIKGLSERFNKTK
jgi:hypothetical protein